MRKSTSILTSKFRKMEKLKTSRLDCIRWLAIAKLRKRSLYPDERGVFGDLGPIQFIGESDNPSKNWTIRSYISCQSFSLVFAFPEMVEVVEERRSSLQ